MGSPFGQYKSISSVFMIFYHIIDDKPVSIGIIQMMSSGAPIQGCHPEVVLLAK